MEMQFGTAQGLAVNLGFDQRINDLRYNAEANRRAAAEAEAKAKLYADDLDFKNAMNPYDAPLARNNAIDKMKELANIQKTNPNYKYDPMVQVQMKAIRNDIKDNPIVRRGMMVDSAYNEYLKDRQEALKNPQAWDMDALDAQGEQFKNYFQHGHSEGEAGFIRDGAQPVIYTRPAPFIDLSKKGLDIGNHFNDMVHRNLNQYGSFETIPNEQSLNAQAHQFYTENKRQLDKEYTSKGIDPIKAAKDFISAGIKREFEPGDINAAWDRAFKEKQLKFEKDKIAPKEGYTPYDYFVDPRNLAGRLTQDEARVIVGDTPNIEIHGLDGSKADLTGLLFNADGRYMKRGNKHEIPSLIGFVKVPLETALAKGIIVGDPEDAKKGNFGDDGVRIAAPYKGKAAFEHGTDKDGKPYVKVSHEILINPNDQKLRQRFNSFVDVDKLVPESSNPYQSRSKQVAPEGAAVDQKGNVFDATGKYLGKRDDFQ